MPDEEGRRPTIRSTVKRANQPGVGNMDPGARPMVRVEKSIGRHASRAYCPACGAKRTKDGSCPRGHPN